MGTNAFPLTDRGAPSPAVCGDIDLRIAADGTWYYHGSPIGRKELVKLFASVLTRDADGSFWLKTPVEKARIRVDDAPFLGVELAREGGGMEQILRLRTNIDEWVTIGPAHPLRMARGPEMGGLKPYVAVRPGLDALLARPVYYELAGLAVSGGDSRVPVEAHLDERAGIRPRGSVMGVWSAGAFFALESSDSPPNRV